MIREADAASAGQRQEEARRVAAEAAEGRVVEAASAKQAMGHLRRQITQMQRQTKVMRRESQAVVEKVRAEIKEGLA